MSFGKFVFTSQVKGVSVIVSGPVITSVLLNHFFFLLPSSLRSLPLNFNSSILTAEAFSSVIHSSVIQILLCVHSAHVRVCVCVCVCVLVIDMH